MAENKTKPTKVSVEGYLAKIRDAEMWGSMVGFGQYHYRYASGHEGDCFQMGFASRKPDLVLYLMNGPERHAQLLAKLGKHKLGKACLYLRRVADVDSRVLNKLISASAREMKKGGSPCS